MKYIDFESWTITWLHEGNVIVEDQLTHNFKRAGSHHPRPYFTPHCKMSAEAGNDSVLRCPWHWQAGLWKLDWLRLSIVSLLWFTFLFIVLWNVFGVQPIIRNSRFCSGVPTQNTANWRIFLGVWRKRWVQKNIFFSLVPITPYCQCQ